LSAAFVFSAARLHSALWRYVSLADILRLIAGITIALLLALLVTFTWNRLEGIPRSLPVIQWFLLVTAMGGSRVAVRLAGEWQGHNRQKDNEVQKPIEHVLVVGKGDLTELYLRSVAEFAPANLVIVGILSPGKQLRGRLIRSYKILGEPEDVRQIVAQLDVHGVTVDRIVVTQPFEQLSRRAQDGLEELERSSITIDWLIESLGLSGRGTSDSGQALGAIAAQPPIIMEEKEGLPLSGYHQLKRSIDVIMAVCIILVLAPVFLLLALLVAVDVGLPLVFWQQRPGRYGRPFKLFKFRTMGGAHDAVGNRLPDELRSSSIGRFLRRSRLDELPQLYNILIGEMSFVGPRPLLPVDQPNGQTSRLLVRPGLTGWAQVNGGRDISPEEKAELDLWYVENASFRLDIKILWRTLGMMIFGERLNIKAQQPSMRTNVESKPPKSNDISPLIGTHDGS
jgi:lipopolysaccharide/colanic/teichoic acid biosynthesis glycosyltransferase